MNTYVCQHILSAFQCTVLSSCVYSSTCQPPTHPSARQSSALGSRVPSWAPGVEGRAWLTCWKHRSFSPGLCEAPGSPGNMCEEERGWIFRGPFEVLIRGRIETGLLKRKGWILRAGWESWLSARGRMNRTAVWRRGKSCGRAARAPSEQWQGAQPGSREAGAGGPGPWLRYGRARGG